MAITDRHLLQRAADRCGLSVRLVDDDGGAPTERVAGTLRVRHVPLAVVEQPGHPDPRNATHILATLAEAADGCMAGHYGAVVTAPLQKASINDAGIRFSGHTEFFAERARARVVMMLASPELRVALVTTHLPLQAVPAALTATALEDTLRIVQRELRAKFGLADPRIAVLGLNPHAGEGGHLGREELDTIIPVLERLRAEGMRLLGPLPADTAFVPALRSSYDAVVGDVPRPGTAGAQERSVRPHREPDPGAAVHPHLGGPRHRAGPCRQRQGRRVQPDRGSAHGVAADRRRDILLHCRRALTPGTAMNARPKKSFGQHFLHDRRYIERIVSAISPKPDDRMVEIGPGEGALTLPLLAAAGKLTAIELDTDLIPDLQARAASVGQLTVIHADVLKVDFTGLAAALGSTRLRIAGNLPYYISSPILFHCVEHADAIADMHFMLQKEVVDRMAAEPGSKVYGRLSVMLQLACRVEPLFTVPPGAFRPPPKVDSAVVRLVPLRGQRASRRRPGPPARDRARRIRPAAQDPFQRTEAGDGQRDHRARRDRPQSPRRDTGADGFRAPGEARRKSLRRAPTAQASARSRVRNPSSGRTICG